VGEERWQMTFVKKYYIYKITNTVNGWVYIGSTSYNPIGRWTEHERALRKQKHINKRLYEDYEKHGMSSFLFELLGTVENRESMFTFERMTIREYALTGKCYNSHHNYRFLEY
jgi:hypothetical protein